MVLVAAYDFKNLLTLPKTFHLIKRPSQGFQDNQLTYQEDYVYYFFKKRNNLPGILKFGVF